MKLLFTLVILFFLSGCIKDGVDEIKGIITEVKTTIGASPLGKHCDVKNKVICYEQNNSTGFNCVTVEKPMCKEEELIK